MPPPTEPESAPNHSTDGAMDEAAARPGGRAVEEDQRLRAAVGALHNRLHLKDVRTQRLAGHVVGEPPFEVATVSVHIGPPEVLVEPPRFACRFTQRVTLLADEGEQLASVEVVLVLEFELEGDDTPADDAVSVYVDRNAFFIAYPYLREAVQAMTQRLGLDPVVLGILARGDARPTELTLMRRRRPPKTLMERHSMDPPTTGLDGSL